MSDEWEVLGTEPIADYGVFRVCRMTMRHRDEAQEFKFHIVERPDCVQIIPVLPDGRIIMVEQFRQGVERESLEFPAGVLETGEDPLSGARPELEEETGYRGANARVIARIDPDTAILRTVISVVLVEGCEASGEKNPDPAEHVRVQVFAPEQIDGLIASGRITLASSIAAWHSYRSAAQPAL